jgi:hypothetical protein
VGSLLLLEVLGEQLLVSLGGLLAGLPVVDLGLLVDALSAESLLSDEALDLGGLEEGLVALLDLAPDDVLGHVVLLLEHEHFADVVGSLGSEASGLGIVSEPGDFLLALLDHLQGNGGEVRAADATTNGLSLALAISAGTVGGGAC